jgi:uncharacterized protein (DUF305 family)
MKRNSLLIAGASVSLVGVALAQGSMGGMGGMGAGSMPGMSMKMDMSGLEKLQGKAFDRAFLSMMVPHHQMAVDMARAVLPVGKDATVKTWANRVIKDQAREITQMNTLLKSYGGSDAAMANMMKTSMSGMADMVKKARNPDVAFVEGMVPHHASAIDMAKLALEKSSDARVLKLSRDIVRAQAQEMYDFRTWLMKRGM